LFLFHLLFFLCFCFSLNQLEGNYFQQEKKMIQRRNEEIMKVVFFNSWINPFRQKLAHYIKEYQASGNHLKPYWPT
jgi:hypothetical protein